MKVTLTDKEYLLDIIEESISQFVKVIKQHASKDFFNTVEEPEINNLENICDVMLFLIGLFKDLLVKEIVHFEQLNN